MLEGLFKATLNWGISGKSMAMERLHAMAHECERISRPICIQERISLFMCLIGLKS